MINLRPDMGILHVFSVYVRSAPQTIAARPHMFQCVATRLPCAHIRMGLLLDPRPYRVLE